MLGYCSPALAINTLVCEDEQSGAQHVATHYQLHLYGVVRGTPKTKLEKLLSENSSEASSGVDLHAF